MGESFSTRNEADDSATNVRPRHYPVAVLRHHAYGRFSRRGLAAIQVVASPSGLTTFVPIGGPLPVAA